MVHPPADRAPDAEPPAGLTEAMMENLVRAFYGAGRKHPVLGPIFEERLAGHWEEHIAKLTDFWSQIGLRSGRYSGRPLPAHFGMGLEPAHFEAWLGLFEATAREVLPPEGAAFFIARARRIAESFQMGLNIGDKALDFRAMQARRPKD
ncbi:group III truncated hemoglobin [uncultured Rhodoblastus sp.]|uniref:group III truncated hemoglobin n=1 Tax=uncultured Rhodoblastus sp. TaxID=543037 RepID=UPI0025E29B88|nr:group III truncated hemoglobin [uncultured Rhodoblastus sp.]